MRNRTGVLLLTVIITGICLFYLSFTVKFMGLEKKVEEKANSVIKDSLDKENKLSGKDLQTLKKSLMKEERARLNTKKVYLGMKYEEVKKFSLNLGLDLQGGVHATVTIDPVELVRAMADYEKDNPILVEALTKARKTQKSGTDVDFTDEFYNNIKPSLAGGLLNKYFPDKEGTYGFTSKTTDEKVLDVVRTNLDEAMGKAVTRLRNRFDRFGASQAIISPNPRTNRIEIQLPGVEEEAAIRRQITTVAELNFMGVFSLSDVSNGITKLDEMLKQEEYFVKASSVNNNTATPDKNVNVFSSKTSDDDTTASTDSTDTDNVVDNTVGDSSSVVNNTKVDAPTDYIKVKRKGIVDYFTPVSGKGDEIRFVARNIDSVRALFAREDVKLLFKDDFKIMFSNPRDGEGEYDPNKARQFYFIKTEPLLSGDNVENASAESDLGQRYVSMRMNAEGTQIWSRVTEEYTGKSIAVVLDELVISAPRVNGKIPNGSSQISGSFSATEAKTLADFLEVGSLPTPVEIERLVFVGPTLGKEAISRGLFSMLVGLGLVILFMILYYSKGGVVANVALLFNILFILGVLSIPKLGATLTLSGIAGIVLTMGMAIDANVLIFERIREELKAGKHLKNAITLGYQKAFWTIVDSNVTTLITAIILASVGTGLVKGFAVTLIIGICCSFFSSVYITRLILEFAVGKKENPNFGFITPISKKLFQNMKFKFINNRFKAYGVSSVIIIIGIIGISMDKLTPGVEFSGGRAYIYQFNKEISSTEVKAKINDNFPNSAMNVKTFDSDDKLRIYTNYLTDPKIPQDSASKVVSATVQSSLEEYFKEYQPQLIGTEEVGASIADDIKSSAYKAIIIALIAIFIYILIRFLKWQFSLGAIVALFHDVMMVLSIFAIAGLLGFSFELDEVFVAAMLTIVGYSINDTVVVFDRVREFMKLSPKANLADTLNSSINSTMSRTLMTSLTTLLVVIVLFLFGGEALRGFSFALLTGVLVGTYSSIFIATPIVLDTSGKSKPKEATPEVESKKA